MIEAVSKLETIIHIQSDVIDDLFRLLGAYMPADELDNLPAVDKINEAAKLRKWYMPEEIE